MFVFFVGSEAKKLFDDAEGMLKKVMETKSLWATGVVAFFPSNSVGDDIHVFEDDNERKGSPKAVFYGLRQQVGKAILKKRHVKRTDTCQLKEHRRMFCHCSVV